MSLKPMTYFRYEPIPQLEECHEIDAAIAIRDLADKIDRLRGNVNRHEDRYRRSLKKAEDARKHKGYKS